jgi:hypothetical protein
LALLIVGIVLGGCDFEFTRIIFVLSSGIALIASVITIVWLCTTVSKLSVIDAKIEMYETENATIETQIAETVSQYQNYEKETFTELAPESAVTLVALYPELKSDTLVQKQIEVYLENNSKIKELKETKISGKVYRWWLYFGG